MIRWAHGLLRSRYSVGRVSSCTTRLCRLLGTVVLQGDYRRTCRTSDARLAMLPALWEGHFGDGKKAVGGRRKACKPFSAPETLGETGRAHHDPPKTALQGRSGVRAFGRGKPRRDPCESMYSHRWTLGTFCEGVADLGD